MSMSVSGEPGFMALFDPTDSNNYDFPALEDNELPATFTSSPGGAIGTSTVSQLERSSNSTSTRRTTSSTTNNSTPLPGGLARREASALEPAAGPGCAAPNSPISLLSLPIDALVDEGALLVGGHALDRHVGDALLFCHQTGPLVTGVAHFHTP